MRVPCGMVSILGLRVAQRLGVPARLVGTFANQRNDMLDVPDDTLESHAMLEVWEEGRWVVYDLDGNVRAVDQNSKGVGVNDFAQGPRRYDSLATDELYDPAESPYPAYERWLFANHEAWYDRVLGTVAVKPPGWTVYFFTDPALKEQLGPTAGYEWLEADRWRQLVDAPPPAATPPARPTPLRRATTVQPAATALPAARPPTPVRTAPGCRLKGQAIRRQKVSCARAQRTLRSYLRAGPCATRMAVPGQPLRIAAPSGVCWPGR